MNLTNQQCLVLFDIAKYALNNFDGFAGYQRKELFKLINDIIKQQDNQDFIKIIEDEEDDDFFK